MDERAATVPEKLTSALVKVFPHLPRFISVCAYLYMASNSERLRRLESPAEDRLLRVSEVQWLLGYSRSTVYRLIKAGRLPTVRLAGTIRFRYQSMLSWMADHETPAIEPPNLYGSPTDSKRTQ